jgi:hypothetical protein
VSPWLLRPHRLLQLHPPTSFGHRLCGHRAPRRRLQHASALAAHAPLLLARAQGACAAPAWRGGGPTMHAHNNNTCQPAAPGRRRAAPTALPARPSCWSARMRPAQHFSAPGGCSSVQPANTSNPSRRARGRRRRARARLGAHAAGSCSFRRCALLLRARRARSTHLLGSAAHHHSRAPARRPRIKTRWACARCCGQRCQHARAPPACPRAPCPPAAETRFGLTAGSDQDRNGVTPGQHQPAGWPTVDRPLHRTARVYQQPLFNSHASWARDY